MIKDLIFLQCVPHDSYFAWQIEVQITNFRKFNISKNMHICVWYPKKSKELDKWKVIQEKYPEVKIFFYEDEGVNLNLYIPQLRPHTLKKHFKEYPYLSKNVIFYHDSDIIFNYLPDFDKLINSNICWQSDCSGYLDFNYLEKKEKEGNIPDNIAIKKLADIGGVSIDIIKSYTGKTGGAQTILRNINFEFWEDVERMCIEIRKSFKFEIQNSINSQYFSSENAGFQSWCADMWALNFAQWKRNQVTNITPELDFSWATDSMETFLKKPIFHNAGATGQDGIFYKGAFMSKSPINANIPLPAEDKASRQYVLAIKEVK